LYISDEKGRSFTLSMENVIKGNAVDFQKVSSLDGTFVVNRYNREHTHTPVKRASEIREFDEADIIAVESKKSRMSRPSNGDTENSKQVSTSLEVHKIEETIPASIVQEDVKTYITHNKGGKWELLRSPTLTSQGKPIDCFVEDDCSLHLEIYSHQG
jgi:Sortilin, neurotensin receptor 3,